MDLIWLIRHGESTSNAQEPTADPGSSPLTELGKRQAALVSGLFRKLPDTVVVSPYVRAAMTAAPLFAAHPGLARETWPVQEFTYLCPSKYKGTTMAERRPLVAEYWQRLDPEFVDGPGAESFAAFFKRVRSSLDRLRSLRGFTAVFTHGQFMRAAMWMALTRPAGPGQAEMARFRAFRDTFRLPNTAIVALRNSRNGAFWLKSVEVSHLPPAAISH